MSILRKTPPSNKRELDDPSIDSRQQTFNDGSVGQVDYVSTSIDLITRLRTIMIDVDLKYLDPYLYDEGKGTKAKKLFKQTLRHWLDHDPLLSKAQVLNTGTGLHINLQIDPVVEFGSTSDRDRWAERIRAVQRVLPSDPKAPGLNALTRPVGSVNSKNGHIVKELRAGQSVRSEEVIQYVDDLRKRPFAIVANILFGLDRVTPCPICRQANSSLGVQDRVGRCYDRCGKVKLEQLFAIFMIDSPTDGED